MERSVAGVTQTSDDPATLVILTYSLPTRSTYRYAKPTIIPRTLDLPTFIYR